MMRYGSVCSGVEAASLAWMPLGWEPAFFAEIEPFPCAVLQQKFGATRPLHPLDPDETTDKRERKMRENWKRNIEKLPDGGSIPNFGDFTKIKSGDIHESIDLLVGGTPCQDLSIAGKRAGFDGKRSSLAIEFVRLAYELGCKWFVWENVPGALSSHNGRDFATLLSLFTGCEIDPTGGKFDAAGFVCPARRDRYGVAWRVLDARFIQSGRFPRGIPQRRARLFVVGYFGDWTRAATVLFDPTSLRGNSPEEQKKATPSPRAAEEDDRFDIRWRDGSDTAATITQTSDDQRMPDRGRFHAVVIDKHCCSTKDCSPALERGGAHEMYLSAGFMEGRGSASGTNSIPSMFCFHGSQDPICNTEHANAIGRNQGQENCLAQYEPTLDASMFTKNSNQDIKKIIIETGAGFHRESNSAGTLERGEEMHHRNLVCNSDDARFSLRRLTPLECERLMGFPDYHTRIAWNGRSELDCPDAPRYHACGNSMCVNVMEWIGTRIELAQDGAGETK